MTTPYCVATRDISRCFRQRNASLGRSLVEICSWRTGDGVWVNASGALTAHMRIQTPVTSRSQPETFLKSTRSPPLEGSIQKNLLPQRSAFSKRAPTGTRKRPLEFYQFVLRACAWRMTHKSLCGPSLNEFCTKGDKLLYFGTKKASRGHESQTCDSLPYGG